MVVSSSGTPDSACVYIATVLPIGQPAGRLFILRIGIEVFVQPDGIGCGQILHDQIIEPFFAITQPPQTHRAGRETRVRRIDTVRLPIGWLRFALRPDPRPNMDAGGLRHDLNPKMIPHARRRRDAGVDHAIGYLRPVRRDVQ